MNNREFGQRGEDAAAKHLNNKGYKILSRNYCTGRDELDIIAYRKGTLVYAEVKTRSSDNFGEPKTAVNVHKMRCLLRAADNFEHENMKYDRTGQKYIQALCCFLFVRWKKKMPVQKKRFDIIEVYMTKSGELQKILQHENAFNKATPKRLEKNKKTRNLTRRNNYELYQYKK